MSFIERLKRCSEDLKAGRVPEPITHSTPITNEEAEYECGQGYPDSFRERKPEVGVVTTIGPPSAALSPNLQMNQAELTTRLLSSLMVSDVAQPMMFHVHGWNADKEGLSRVADQYLARCTAVPFVARNLPDDGIVVCCDTDIVFPLKWYEYVKAVFNEDPQLGMAYPCYTAESYLTPISAIEYLNPKSVMGKLAGKATDHCIFFRAKMVKDYLWFTEDWMIWNIYKGWKIALLPLTVVHYK